MDTETTRRLVVAVGASAGGLAALKDFVSNLPVDSGMSFIIVQHLDPSHKSMLVEILAKQTAIGIEEIVDRKPLEPDHVYVIPPSSFLEVSDGLLRLVPTENTRGSRKAIDHLMSSLARDCGDASVGIIMSGSGNDGTAGLRAIRAAGGLTLVQEPATAEHPSMPQSAIDADVVDRIMAVDAMPVFLQRYAESPLRVAAEIEKKPGVEDAGESLATITAILKSHEDFNLRQYKPPTVQRRIARRMSLTAVDSYSDYLGLLRESGDERAALTKDLLINVTNFFRDPEAFEELKNEVVRALLKQADPQEDIRVWVAGCASGEEAYSIAIILRETIEEAALENPIRIFATDVDEFAIGQARKGVYPDSIAANVPQNLLEKYFVDLGEGGGYRINDRIRESISFAVHDVGHDPPFGRMHLISCRNLLIYLKKEVQEKIFRSFYFALKDNAYLFLGSSETVGAQKDLYRSVSKKWRIYRKRAGIDNPVHAWQQSHHRWAPETRRARSRNERTADRVTRTEQIRRDLLDAYVRPGVVVGSDGVVLYTHGNWKPYMCVASGEPRTEIGDLVVPELRSRIRSALFKVRKSRKPLSFFCALPAEEAGGTRTVRVDLAPLPNVSREDDAVIGITFEDIEAAGDGEAILTRDDELRVNESLGRELAETREELQNTIEELETSTEELKASHEEALSTNEELQSANEELEASGEELRSLNEELSTVNAQLKEKLRQLKAARDDVENFFQSTNVPTMFLDTNLEIKRFTPAAEHLLKLGTRDIGRPITALGTQLATDLADDCVSVLQDFQPKSRETSSGDDRWFIRQVTPYRTEDRRVEGVVVVFQDITEIRELSHRAESRERQQAVVANLGMMALSGDDPAALMHNAVRQVAHVLDADYCKVLQYRPESSELLLIAGVGWHEGLVGKATVSDDRASQAGFTLVSQNPVIVRRLSEEKRFDGPTLLTDHQVVSGISCIINHTDPPFGVLGVHTRRFRKFTDDDANFLVSVANLLSVALQGKKAQTRIRDSAQQFRSLANSIPQLAWSADPTGAMVWFNKRWYDYTGARFKDVRGWGWAKLHHPEHAERVMANIKSGFDAGRNWEDTFPLRGKSGEYRWFLSRAVAVRNDDDEIVSWFGTNTDITEKLDQESALRASEEKLRLALNTNLIGTFEYYLQEERTTWNGALLDIWGVPTAQVVTQEIFWEGVHPDDAEAVARALDAASDPNGDGHYHATYRVINRQSGELFWVEASGQTLFENGVAVRMVGLVIDITAQRTLQEDLQSAVAQLELANTKKNDFLAVLGHELRNPLAVLSTGVETLAGKPEALGDVLDVMENSVETMARLLDDLLDLNRISQDRIQLEMRPIDLAVPIRQATLAIEKSIRARHQQLETAVDDGLVVEGDSMRLEQVFANLLANASKYTPTRGRISIEAKRNREWIEVSVADTGVGIGRQDLERVFEPFFQVKPKDRASTGLGVGLALVRKIIELHGGTVKAASGGNNDGTKFVVRLPLSEARVSAPPGRKRPVKCVEPGTKVVVIDDNEDVLKTLPPLLESVRCVVSTANCGELGLQRVEESKPKAVLVDIGLPDISGYDVAERLRANGYRGLLVAISGYGHEEARERSSKAGFDLHLAKPARLAEITEALSRAPDL